MRKAYRQNVKNQPRELSGLRGGDSNSRRSQSCVESFFLSLLVVGPQIQKQQSLWLHVRKSDSSTLDKNNSHFGTNDILKSIHTTNNVKNEHDDIDNNFTRKRELTRFLSKNNSRPILYFSKQSVGCRLCVPRDVRPRVIVNTLADGYCWQCYQ